MKLYEQVLKGNNGKHCTKRNHLEVPDSSNDSLSKNRTKNALAKNIELFGAFDIKIAPTTPLPLPVRSAPCEGLLVSGACDFG